MEGGSGRVDPVDYRKMCEERGISIPSTGASFQELVEDPLKVAATAKTLGAKYVMCAWIPHKGRGNFSKADADKTIKIFNEAGKVLIENDLTFCYHAQGYEFQPYQDSKCSSYYVAVTNSTLVF